MIKHSSTVFLKTAIILIASGVLFGLIRFPLTEGRAAHLDLLRIYADPLIIYGYIASLPFFAALFQGWKLLSFIDTNKVFSKEAVKIVRTIKYCVLISSGFILGGVLFIRFFAHGDDPAGPTGLGMILIFFSVVMATGVAIVEKLLQNAVSLKSENDLTV